MKNQWTRLLLVGIIMISLTLSACGGGGGGADNEQQPERFSQSLILLQDEYSYESLTDADGNTTIDTVSFDKDIIIQLADDQGTTLEGWTVDYKQNKGTIEVLISDPNNEYIDTLYITDLSKLKYDPNTNELIAQSSSNIYLLNIFSVEEKSENEYKVIPQAIIIAPLAVKIIIPIYKAIKVYTVSQALKNAASLSNLVYQSFDSFTLSDGAVFETTYGEIRTVGIPASLRTVKGIFALKSGIFKTANELTAINAVSTLTKEGVEFLDDELTLMIIDYLLPYITSDDTRIRFTVQTTNLTTLNGPLIAIEVINSDLLASWGTHLAIGTPFYNVFFEGNEWRIITFELTSETAAKATFEGNIYTGTWSIKNNDILSITFAEQDASYYKLLSVEEKRLSVCFSETLVEIDSCTNEYFYFNLSDAQAHGVDGGGGGGISAIDAVGFYFDSSTYDAVIISKAIENAANFVLFESNNGIDYSQGSNVANLQEIEGSVAFVVQAVSSSYYKILTYDSNSNLIAESKPILLDPSLGRLQPETFQVYHSDNIEHTGLEGASSYLVMIEEESGDENVVVLLTINGNHLWIYDNDWGAISTEFVRKPLVSGSLYGVSIIALDAEGSPIGSTGSLQFTY